MPLGKNVRYRWKRMKNGRMVRLAFRGKKVVEVKAKGGKAKRVARKRTRSKRKK